MSAERRADRPYGRDCISNRGRIRVDHDVEITRFGTFRDRSGGSGPMNGCTVGIEVGERDQDRRGRCRYGQTPDGDLPRDACGCIEPGLSGYSQDPSL